MTKRKGNRKMERVNGARKVEKRRKECDTLRKRKEGRKVAK